MQLADTDSYSATPQDLAARLRYSQERLRDAYETAPSPRTYRVWAAVVALTAGWGKAADAVYVSAIERQAGLAKGKASAPLRDLHDRGVIEWVKEPGQRSIGRVSLPPIETVRKAAEGQAQLEAAIARAKGSA
jgi:hypothetical protein